MDCNTARMLAELRGNRANELPDEDTASLNKHLQTCAGCQSLLQVEKKLDAPLLRTMSAIAVPPGLKARIFDRLATERGAVQRRRFWYATATAALVIFAVGVLTWNPERKPKIDLNELVQNADQLVDDPQGAADAWLIAQGIQQQPPEPFNPHLMAFHGMVTVQGKQVAMLCYKSYEDGISVSAKVYIIRGSDFDLSALQKPPDGGSWGERGNQVKVYPGSDQTNKLIFVVIYNSRTLEPFLKQFQST